MVVSKIEALLNKALRVQQAKQIHALIVINGVRHLESSLIRQVLISKTSFSHDVIRYVHSVLCHMQNPDVFSWSCTIRFLSQHHQFSEAFGFYSEMQRMGLSPNELAMSTSLKACARIEHKKGGTLIHAQVHKYGFCGVVVQTALVDLYSKLGDIETARKVFDEMPERNVVSWNSVLAGYLRSGKLAMARSLFDEMLEKDVVSWNSMISGYGRAGNMEEACALFHRMPERSVASWNTIISGYIDCGEIDLARSFFDDMPERNNVSWLTMISGYSKRGNVKSAEDLFSQMNPKDLLVHNAMIACYSQNSRSKEAIHLFNEMLQPNVNIQPDKMTFASVISACSQLGDLRLGSWIESYMNQLRIKIDDHLATALIDLYAKCGSINKACELFQGLQKKDVVSYSAMILGCGINGCANDAIQLFDEMTAAQIPPNLATFTGILTAYNHVGLVEEGYACFTSMQEKHGLVPSADNYGVVVDLLGRAGKLEEAYGLIKSMPMKPHAGVWGALLLACSIHKNVEIGEVAAERCFELEPDSTGYGSLLAGIYASAERWDDAKRLRMELLVKGSGKIPGCSWTELSSS